MDMKQLEAIETLVTSGDLEEQFEYSPDERRYEILDYLEKLMELGEAADELATKLIFKNSQLQALMGEKNQK